MGHIKEPKHIPLLLKLGIRIAERKTGKRMEPTRVLAWYPKAAVGSGVLESLVAHEEPGISRRLLQLVRMQVSILVNCSFCIDMNSDGYEQHQITREEIEGLQDLRPITDISTFSREERIALQYAKELTTTPLPGNDDTISLMKECFDERQFVVLATTAAQVNYWARLIKGLGIPPAGFRTECSLPPDPVL